MKERSKKNTLEQFSDILPEMFLSARHATYILFTLASAGGLLTFSFRVEKMYAETLIPSTFRFERTLKTGTRGEEVRYLQVFLNRDIETRVNTPGLIGGSGNETDFFGAATRAAVVRFQNKYAGEVLRPANLRAGTGLVGAFTRAKLNVVLEETRAAAAPPQATTTPSIPSLREPFQGGSPEDMGEREEREIASVTLTPTTTAPVSFEELNLKTRAALVNIICTTIRSGSFNPVSGSGIIIDPKGVILTNAHVAQYFLLKDYLVPNFVTCTIRTGEPARNRYKARLLYLAPQWVERNFRKIVESEPTGTGQHDFALLLIAESVNPDVPLPSAYPAVALQISEKPLRRKDNAVLVAGYPAGFLGGINIQKELYPVSSIAQTGRLYSFGSTTPDIVSVAGSPLAQQGASGGAVIGSDGKLLGLISTASTGATTGERELFAITGAHMERSFAERNSFSVIEMLANADLTRLADEFNKNVAPALTKLLESALQKE